MKKCNKCELFKRVDEFWKDKTSKDGLCSLCIDCKKRSQKKYRQTNEYKEKRKEWVQDNIEHIKNYPKTISGKVALK